MGDRAWMQHRGMVAMGLESDIGPCPVGDALEGCVGVGVGGWLGV